MGFFDKLMFWKKNDDFGLKDDFGAPNSAMDMGFSKQDFGQQQGMPDMTNFQGVGNFQEQQAMNRSINQQLGPNYMDDSSQGFSSFAPKQQPVYSQLASSGHEIEVVSAKLDAIKAMLDSINQRIANLERVAYGEQENKRRYNW